MRIFALVDCNNFYASCERLFRPELKNRPVVVLSNNDGCVIARSQEAKAIGVPMGVPAYKYKNFFLHNDVEVFSSNYALYGDLSQRVTSTLASITPDLEVYSIDESFLEFPPCMLRELPSIGQEIRDRILKWTGIPVSVGFGETKTQAKLSSNFAKKYKKTGRTFSLCARNDMDRLLEKVPVTDIWGIGRRHGKRLIARGISTARAFRDLPNLWLKKNMSVTGLHTALELRGTPCFELDNTPQPKKTISSSRSFGRPVKKLSDLEESVAAYVSRAGEKLREQQSMTRGVMVYLTTNRFNNLPQYSNRATRMFTVATDYTPELIRTARQCIRSIYKEGYSYKKTGVVLLDLCGKYNRQCNLLEMDSKEDEDKKDKLMTLLDSANGRFGRQTLSYASEGIEQPWKMNRNFKSPAYTTCWDELPKIG
ncbi:Y-family DNA polymerase [Desulfovibrio sp. JC010]|uniref:Y-family DNA polymerase n=1 Tax=Desulfovibrio sp. JC010 TaxID=2593641 RepID=UPI0013D1668F|nr:Y-family DNA polymerase [Desulfovibrio sp. JC010]NDV26388.1 Y-family DNA polymerase [Desulfovibrio sp. JC010]